MRVPVVRGTSPGVAALPGVRMQAAPSARDLGAGAGVANEQANADLSSAAQMLAGTLRAIEFRKEETVLLNADSLANKLVGEKRIEWKQLKGINAEGLTERATKELADIETQVRENLTTERQREGFALRWNQLKGNALLQASEHQATEGRHALIDSGKSNAAANIELAASDPRNKELQEAVQGQIIATVARMSSAAGLDPTATLMEQRKYLSMLHDKVASQILLSSATEAAEYIKEHAGNINADTRERLFKVVATQSSIERAQTIADELEQAGVTEAEGLKRIRAQLKGEDETRAVAEWRDRWGQRAVAIERDQRDAADQAYRIVNETGSWTKIPAEIVQRMDPKAFDALKQTQSQRAYTDAERARAASQRALADDQRTALAADRARDREQGARFNEIHLQAMTDPSVFLRRDLMIDYPNLNPQQRDYLARLRADLSSGKPPDAVLTPAQLIAAAADQLGLRGDGKADERAAFTVRVGRMIYADREDKAVRGKTQSQADVEQIVDRAMLPMNVRGAGWFGSSKEIPAGQLTPDQAAVATIEGVPQSQVAIIVRELQSLNLPISPEAIQRVYKRATAPADQPAAESQPAPRRRPPPVNEAAPWMQQ